MVSEWAAPAAAASLEREVRRISAPAVRSARSTARSNGTERSVFTEQRGSHDESVTA